MDRTLGSGKPVDPATRLSELLAQSLEELTRPFEPPRGGANPAAGAAPVPAPGTSTAAPEAAAEQPAQPDPSAGEPRVDADRALAELEAELFAAAKQVDREAAARPPAEPEHDAHGAETEEPAPEHVEGHPDHPSEPLAAEPAEAVHIDAPRDLDEHHETAPDIIPQSVLPRREPEPEQAQPSPDAARVIARVRRLMLVSMAVTIIAVGSVFGFIGYRIMKGEGQAEKKADKLPEMSPIPNDVTLSLPRGARVIQSAVAGDRLVMTFEIDGKTEVRTFDVKTLQPAGRLGFSDTP